MFWRSHPFCGGSPPHPRGHSVGTSVVPWTLRSQKEVGFTWTAAGHSRNRGTHSFRSFSSPKKQARVSLGALIYDTCFACALCFRPARPCALPTAAQRGSPTVPSGCGFPHPSHASNRSHLLSGSQKPVTISALVHGSQHWRGCFVFKRYRYFRGTGVPGGLGGKWGFRSMRLAL